jgi:hypothetical protein
MSEWKQYRRTNVAEMRPVVAGEDLEGVSISDPDKAMRDVNRVEFDRGFVARNPANYADQWYVARAYFDANFEVLWPNLPQSQ